MTTNQAAAVRFYKRATPLHGRSKAYASDLEQIKSSPQPTSSAEKLVAQRTQEQLDAKLEAMLREHQGRKKRYQYNQEAVVGIEHLLDQPMDPHTQMPIWKRMLAATKGTTIPRSQFLRDARAILCQHSLYDPETMGA